MSKHSESIQHIVIYLTAVSCLMAIVLLCLSISSLDQPAPVRAVASVGGAQ